MAADDATTTTEPAPVPEASEGKGTATPSRAAATGGGQTELSWWRNPIAYIRAIIVELKKVAWPSRKELVSYSIVVLVVTAILTTIIWGMDEVLRRVATRVFG